MKTFDKVSFKGTFRNYQQRVLDNSDKYLLNGKINIVAAPGSGKTILGLELIKKLNAPTIILSPTTTIKYQWGDRFNDSFLDKQENVDDYFSYDLHEITLINSITYQALHSIMNKLPLEEDDVVIDYSDLDIFELVRKYKVKTICLDEAHHLQNEWQKSLEKFVEQLGDDVKIIALTATPPYDAGRVEWQRYEKVCGPIDEEIFVPELVKEGTLCPHQDYIYFNYPTKEEAAVFSTYKIKVLNAIGEIRQLDIFNKIYGIIKDKYYNDKEYLFENSKPFIALLIIINSLGIEIDQKIIKGLTTQKTLPAPDFVFYERSIVFLLENESILIKEEKEQIVKILKQYNVIEKDKVNFDLKENIKHKLLSSVGKLNSIAKITEAESKNMGDSLRLLILTDYIKKESIKGLFSDVAPLHISVVTIFEVLVKSNPNYKMGILSGNLIVLPTSCKEHLKNQKVRCTKIGDTIYSEFTFSSMKNKDKVDLVSNLFEKGIINIIIGTKALLGEGWDSPCINTLILASFVGSFMLSNQMRGRAIRIDKNNPNKVSNIWHLATLEPQYVFEDNLLNSLRVKRQTDFNYIQSYDYETLARRFDCFVGPNYETGEIESGIDRLTIIRPPFNKKGVENINETMLSLATKRDDSNNKWKNSLIKSFKIAEEIEVPKQLSIPPFAYINVSGLIASGSTNLLLMVAFSTVLRTFLSTSAKAESNKYYLLIAAMIGLLILFSIFSIVFGKLIYKWVIHSSPKKNMTFIAKALLETLQYSQFISDRVSLDVVGNDVYIGIQLRSASRYEQNIFNEAVTEMFTQIDNPKYLLILKKKGKLNYNQSFACPSILGKKKAMVELFSDNLNGRVGDFEIIYTRNDEGREMLLKCRKLSFITENEKELKRRKKISRFE